jgi:hypothetical protein
VTPARLQDAIRLTLRRAQTAGRLQQALRNYADATGLEIDEQLAELTRCRDAVEAQARDGLSRVNAALRRGAWPEPDLVLGALASTTQRWDESLVDVACKLNGLYVSSALEKFNRFAGIDRVRTCEHCGFPLKQYRYVAPGLSGCERLSGECQRCFSQFNYPADGIRVDLDTSRQPYSPGDEISMKVLVTGYGSGADTAPGALAVVLNGDSMRHETFFLYRASDGLEDIPTISASLPDTAGNEVHPLWVVHAKDLVVSLRLIQVAVGRVSSPGWT